MAAHYVNTRLHKRGPVPVQKDERIPGAMSANLNLNPATNRRTRCYIILELISPKPFPEQLAFRFWIKTFTPISKGHKEADHLYVNSEVSWIILIYSILHLLPADSNSKQFWSGPP